MSILLILFISLSAFSSTLESGFCNRRSSDIHSDLADSSKRISFRNSGGLLNGGVCWWHSRLQRSSVYLARFNPQRSKPNGAQIRGILSALKKMNQVVEIGGYRNFFEFTKGEEPSVQALLESWQKEDGILYFQWIRGLSGKHQLPARDLKVKMDELVELVSQSPTPVWAMAQMPGITSHSFLIRSVETLANGYNFELIDSNAPSDLRYVYYRHGDESLKLQNGSKPFVLYSGFQTDFKRIKSTLAEFCRWNPHSFMEEDLFGKDEIREGEIEPEPLDSSL